MFDKPLLWLRSARAPGRAFPRGGRARPALASSGVPAGANGSGPSLPGGAERAQPEGRFRMKLKVTPSTGNVFRDLGFRHEEAEHLLVRADLMIQVQKRIASRRLKQRDAAKLLRVSQPRVSDLLHGRIDLFSTDALIDMLARLGARVRLSIKPRSEERRGGEEC